MRLQTFLFVWVKREIWVEEPQCTSACKAFQIRQKCILLLWLELERLELESLLQIHNFLWSRRQSSIPVRFEMCVLWSYRPGSRAHAVVCLMYNGACISVRTYTWFFNFFRCWAGKCVEHYQTILQIQCSVSR
jgi:hypothetical protein